MGAYTGTDESVEEIIKPPVKQAQFIHMTTHMAMTGRTVS
jgi:hypothetical protein